MELIIIDESRIKIMLTETDMHHYALPADSLSAAGASTRRAFRHIFEDARAQVGFDTAGERLFVQLYASRGGGCEIFVTKLGESDAGDYPGAGDEDMEELYALDGTPAEDTETGAAEDTAVCTSGERHLLARLQKEGHMEHPHTAGRPPREVHPTPAETAAYRIPESEVLFALCRRLAGIGFDGESVLYIDEDEAWYLFLTPRAGEGMPPFLSEYATRIEDAGTLSLWLSERGRVVCAAGAVGILGQV